MGTTTTKLRAASERDYAFLAQLHHETLHDYVEQAWGWDEADQAQRFRATFSPASAAVIVCEGTDVGVLEVDRRADEIWIANLQLAPSHQRRGIGGRILAELIAEARARAVPIGLRVLKVNPARRLYDRLGFVVVEETDTHFVMRLTA